jgi:hypothetical protein
MRLQTIVEMADHWRARREFNPVKKEAQAAAKSWVDSQPK